MVPQNSDHNMPVFPEPPGDLICPAICICDVAALWRALASDMPSATDKAARRKLLFDALKQAQAHGRAEIARAFGDAPTNAHGAIRGYSYLTDCVIRVAYAAVTAWVEPRGVITTSEHLSLIAVGGYGRGEMAPFSDVDLLFLTPYKTTPYGEVVIETLLYLLWDLGLKVGHASRTTPDCLRLAKDDFTIRTALLELRHVAGDADLAAELEQKLAAELFAKTPKEFTEAKLSEREARHIKQGGQRYVVEPNVKEGKGGLRDLQSLFWISKYIYRTKDLSELVTQKLFTKDEFETFTAAANFLWAVRCHLHLISKRAMDQLTFDLQVEVAGRMGYQATDGQRGVERFMQDYFRHATKVGELTRIFVTALEASHIKKAPVFGGLFQRKPRLRAGFQVIQERLAVKSPESFVTDKLNLLRVFEEGLRTRLLLHPDAMRLVARNLHLIDDDMRKSSDAVRIFCDLLLKHGNPERSLRRMNELGVLSAFIPEFQAIVAMMQFNMYHSYTVDEHTIQTISHLARIERKELVEELPVASGILDEGVNRKVLYIALLLHDIGKGRKEDHSILGARIARDVAPRLGLNAKECETVEWLVRYHLLMSDMAQKRDIADPRTVRDFAKAVQTVERLNLLTVLTVCDISGVGPGVWNNWKAVLIRGLYRQTRKALETGLEALNRENRGAVAKRNLRSALQDWPKAAIKTEVARHNDPYWQGLHVTAHQMFAHLLRDLQADEFRLDLRPDEDRDATRVLFVMADHPGVFSRICGALALVEANIVDARTYTSKDGFVTSAFWVQDSQGHPFAAERLGRLEQMIKKTLLGQVVARDAIKTRDKIKKRERAFKVPTSITFDNDGSEIYTIIEVDTRDRPGLLYDLTRALSHANVNIANAVIATYGEQVVDTFYVKDMFGLKYHNTGKQAFLEDRLRKAISDGFERAIAG